MKRYSSGKDKENGIYPMKIVLIGAGNLATNLGKSLLHKGHDILQVYSRTMESATALADIVGGSPTNDISKVNTEADVYIVSIKDSAISETVPVLCKGKEEKVFLHTAGSVAASVFEGMAAHYGVIYPMQTFSKSRLLDFSGIPCFIEGNDDTALDAASTLAGGISDKVYLVGSDVRRYLHLAAVFACNMVNHCYDISSEILRKHGLPFDVMLPLIDETARKVHQIPPRQAQTGPAVRYDQNVIRAQAELLKDNPMFKQIYEIMSMSISHAARTGGDRP